MAVNQPQTAPETPAPHVTGVQQVPDIPRLRQDIKLFPGPQHRDGSPSWRILDPIRNRFFEIVWREFELLVRWAAGAKVDG